MRFKLAKDNSTNKFPDEPSTIGDSMPIPAVAAAGPIIVPQLIQNTDTRLNPTIHDNGGNANESLAYPRLISLLTPVFYLSFDNPHMNVLQTSIMYEITGSEEVKIFYAIQRSLPRFPPRCDMILVDMDGEALLQLINVHDKPNKLRVLCGQRSLGSIVQSSLSICSPIFKIRDAESREMAIICRRRSCCYCLFLQKLMCIAPSGIFDIIRPSSSKEKPLQHLGTISGNVTQANKRNQGQLGVIELQFENVLGMELDPETKAMSIAAVLFIDFSVFGGQHGHISFKLKVIGGLILLFLAILIIYGIIQLVMNSI